MMYKPLKDKTETDTWNIMTEKKNRCDVCGRTFKSAHGASGICPRCIEEFEPDEMEYVDMDGNVHKRTFPRL